MRDVELDEEIIERLRDEILQRASTIKDVEKILVFLKQSATTNPDVVSNIKLDKELLILFCSEMESAVYPNINFADEVRLIGEKLNINKPLSVLRIIITGEVSGLPIESIIKTIGMEQTQERIADFRAMMTGGDLHA